MDARASLLASMRTRPVPGPGFDGMTVECADPLTGRDSRCEFVPKNLVADCSSSIKAAASSSTLTAHADSIEMRPSR